MSNHTYTKKIGGDSINLFLVFQVKQKTRYDILLKRRLFRWELNQWDDFCVILKGFVMCESLKDSFIRKGTSSGQYSTNQFCKYVIKSGSSNLEWWKLVWLKLAPPEVEVFCWQLMKGRIAMKE